jgi:glucose/arabinose dehydrogenase
MRILTCLSAVTLLSAAGLCCGPVLAQGQQSQESVAEAARKARAKKQTPTKPAKVITDDELQRKAQPSPPAAAVASVEQKEGQTAEKAPGQAGESTDKAATKAPVQGEAYWRRKFREAHENLARAEKELDILQREAQKVGVQYYSDPTKAMREQYDRKDINEKNEKIEAKKKDIEGLKRSIDDLESDLRRAGGDPGWAR